MIFIILKFMITESLLFSTGMAIARLLMTLLLPFLDLSALPLQLYTFLETSVVTLSLLPHFIAFFSEGEIPGTPSTLATTFIAFGKLAQRAFLTLLIISFLRVFDYCFFVQSWIWHLLWVLWGSWSCTYRWWLQILQQLRYHLLFENRNVHVAQGS